MCADGNTRAALPRLFLRVGITGHEWICSRSGGRIHAAPCACGTPRERLCRAVTEFHAAGTRKMVLRFYRFCFTASSLSR